MEAVRRTDKRHYWYVIRELTKREIKRRYARSYLGIVWSVLQPILMMAIISFVFTTLFNRSIENYPVYLLTGQIVWSLFSGATTSALTCIVDNKAMLFRTTYPKEIFIISRCLTALVNFGFVFIAYVPLSMALGIRFKPTALLWLVAIACIMIFSLGIGYIVATLYVYFADVKYLYNVFLRLLFWLTPIFYSADNMPAVVQQVIYTNPVWAYISFGRICTIDGVVPDTELWIKIILWAVAVYALGYLVFKRKESELAAHL